MIKAIGLVLAALFLGGCAVYADPYAYAPPPPVAGVYVAPPPVIVAPYHPHHWDWHGGGWRHA